MAAIATAGSPALRRPGPTAGSGSRPLSRPAGAVSSPILRQQRSTRVSRRLRGTAPCRAAASAPWRFDDLSGASSSSVADIQSGLSTFDDLWREQTRAMERAHADMADMQRQMDQRFAAAQAEARQLEQQAGASSSGRESVEQRGGPGGSCGYRWHRSYERTGPSGSYREWRSESLTVIGVQPPGCSGMGVHMAPPPSALHLGPLSGLSLLLAAAVAGFWAAATAAFHRRFHLTVYREGSRWRMLLLWPVLMLVSSEFRQQFLAALHGQRATRAGQKQQAEDGSEPFAPGMQAGKHA